MSSIFFYPLQTVQFECENELNEDISAGRISIMMQIEN